MASREYSAGTFTIRLTHAEGATVRELFYEVLPTRK